MKTLNEFKTEILINKVRKSERDNSMDELRELIEMKIRYTDYKEDGLPYVLLIRMTSKIIDRKLTLKLCLELNKKGHLTDFNYAGYFRIQIANARKALVKLRPLVIEETKEWPAERKQSDLDEPDLQPFLKGWYL